MWSPVFRAQIQTYYPTMYAALIFFVSFQKEFNGSQIAVEYLKLVMNIGLPMFAYYHIKKNFDWLEDQKFQNKFGTLYSNQNTRKKAILFVMPIFCIKRIIIAIGTIFISQPVAANIMIYVYTSLFSLGFNLTCRPLSSPALNWIDNINELFILTSSYFMLAFSSWMYMPNKDFDLAKCSDNPLLRYNVGKYYIPFLGVALSFNFIIIIFESAKGLRLNYRKKAY